MVVKIIFGGQPMVVDLDSFNKEAISFGRSTDCDIQIQKPYVSRCHGYFYRQNGSWFVKDNNSTNGLIYKKQKVQYAPIGEDDLYIVGNDRNDYVTIHYSKSASRISSGTGQLQMPGNGMGVPKQPTGFGAGNPQQLSSYGSGMSQPSGGYGMGSGQNSNGYGMGSGQNSNSYGMNSGQSLNNYGTGSGQPSNGFDIGYNQPSGGYQYPVPVNNNMNQGKNSFQNQYQNPNQNLQRNMNQQQSMGYNGSGKECTFDGTGGEIFLLCLIIALTIIFTLGLATPWAVTKLLRWEYSHTYIRGRRLAYTGTAMDLFLKCLLWTLLVCVTCGIFSLFLPHYFMKWMNKYVSYEDANVPVGQESPDSFYDGDFGDFFATYIIVYLMNYFTCGIAYPWGLCRYQKFYNSHTVINGDRLDFHGDGGAGWGYLFLIIFLSAITLGIYLPWGICKLRKWIWENTRIQSSGNYNYII